MPVLVGTSGWQYRDWRGRFYPTGVPQRVWLEHHAAHWQTVEVNNAFYRLPDRAALRDGVTLARLLHERGRSVGRVPDMAEVTGATG